MRLHRPFAWGLGPECTAPSVGAVRPECRPGLLAAPINHYGRPARWLTQRDIPRREVWVAIFQKGGLESPFHYGPGA
jgi:hypothetical protein